jgi:hypothetical protein
MNTEMLEQLIHDRRDEREHEARTERLAVEARRTRGPRAERRTDSSLLGYLLTVRRHATQ